MSSDARKMAEEALATVALRYPNGWGSYDTLSVCTDALRALLASEPAPPDGAEVPIAREHPKGEECTHYEADDGDCLTNACSGCCVTYREALATSEAEVARLTALLHECNAVCLCGCPESEHESYGEDGESCGHDDHECIRVAPAVLEIVRRYRVALSDALRAQPTPPPCAPDAPCDGTYACRCKRHYVASAPSPPSDAVREAETPGTNRVEGHDEQAPDTGRTGYEAKQRNVAGDEAPGQIPEVLGVQPTDGAQADSSTGGVSNSVQTLRSRAADGTVAPGGDAVREAVSENDVYTLIGHAEYLRKVRGEEDMPKFFDGLARRLLAALRGGAKGGE